MQASASLPSRGSVILTVVIFTTGIAVIAGSFLSYALAERRLNQRSLLRHESKNAAEALLEFGAAELSVRFQANRNFSTSALRDQPVTVHRSRFGPLFQDSGSTRWTFVQPDSMGLWVSQTTERTRRYIDPNHPENEYDPLRGQRVSTQAVRLLARASSRHPNGVESITHATQLFEVREAALFNYAIFYNIPLEFHPSPQMTILGPVHCNANTNLTEGGTLTFLGTFSTAGFFTADGTTSGRPAGQRISFTNGLFEDGSTVADTISIINPSLNGKPLGTYVDSNLAQRASDHTFTDVASQLWRGYVQDSSHGVMPQNPPGVFTPEQAHDLIEPPDPASTSIVEPQKFSNQAGLYFLVETPPATAQVKNGYAENVVGFHDPADVAAYKASGSAAARKAWRNANPDRIVIPPAGMFNSTRRMYDHREARWVNTVDLDIGAMRTAVANPESAAGFKVNAQPWAIDDPNQGWNGIVYFEVENPSSGWSSTTDVNGTQGAGTRTAVRLVNGSRLPSRGVDSAGLTIATNAPVYVTGHYNADGVLQADLSDMSTPEGPGEVPAAIVADAINLLSQAWWDSSSRLPTGDSGSASTTRPAAAPTEISCAFLTGIVQTSGTANANYSGGVENYPRFHENWSNKALRYRGSIVALFASEIATGPWTRALYNPPLRQWGFNAMFAEGNYPPGTPRLRTYRRLDYRDLSVAEFQTLLEDRQLQFMAM